MRLLLLPISTRRTLIYCQRLNVATPENKSWLDKGTTKAASLWASWEKKESGWQKQVVTYGNKALKRIPYEEWGLKSIPPLSSNRKEDGMLSNEKVEVLFPGALMPQDSILEVLRTLGTERQALHRKRLIWSIVGMPLVAPFALVPVIPNLPFFYLVFRAWSHWRAYSGSKHIEFLLDEKMVTPKQSPILDELYSSGKRSFQSYHTLGPKKAAGPPVEETMVLHESDGKRIAETLDIPELYVELDRAVWQVENTLRAQRELKKEKTELDSEKVKSKDTKI